MDSFTGMFILAGFLVVSLMVSGHLFAHDQVEGSAIEGEGRPDDSLASDSPAAQASDVYGHFSSDVVERGREYRNTKYMMILLRMCVSLVFLYIIMQIQAVKWITHLIQPVVFDSRWLTAGLAAALLTLALSAVTLPVNFYSGYLHEHSFGLSTRALSSWFSDLGKYVLIQLLLAFIIFAGLYLIMNAFPSWWWVISATLFSLFMVALTALSPLIIDPIFNKFTPLEDEHLKSDVIELARNAGIEVGEVYQMDASQRTRKLNAYFTGIGKTKRVVLYDTLIKKSSPEEVKMVVAHELGHWKRDHLGKGLLLATAGTFIVVLVISRALVGSFASGMGITSFNDPAGIPLIMLIVMLLGFLSMPVQNVISRHFEKQADMDSLIFTGDPDTFIKVEERIGRTNLNDVEPNPVIKWLLFSHPPTMDRIRMAEKYKMDTLEHREHTEERI
jgi:STE24 endopeptidase